MSQVPERLDVLIVGAGLSGIDAAYRIQTSLPAKSFAILEGRESLGGTWDLFRYPGIRSDSDMFTLGFPFRPWKDAKAIADGSSILQYLKDTAREFGIDRKIRYGLKVTRASWSSRDALWTVEAEGSGGRRETVECRFLYMCSGYYDYDEGYTPSWNGVDRFKGRLVHPQKWPKDLDCLGKRVVVIGSGATAVTLVPSLAQEAAKVTMLQRSPTYIVSIPAKDAVADFLRAILPAALAHWLVRWKNILLGLLFYNLARWRPDQTRKKILEMVRRELGPGYDADQHFSPRYNPWDQRLCIVPDSDLFRAIKAGKVEVATDEIETFTEDGLRLKSGRDLAADIIVTATGLKLKMLGGMKILIDGAAPDLGRTLTYKGAMYSDIPNFASAFGYTNASWTLKSDLTAGFVCRVLAHMDERALDFCVPRKRDAEVEERPLVDFSSGYFKRAGDSLPKQGSKKPWRLHQNYALDTLALKFGAIEDGALEFGRAATSRR